MVGKPRAEAARSSRVILRAMPKEREAWQRAADRAGLPLSEWIRKRLNSAAKRSSGKR